MVRTSQQHSAAALYTTAIHLIACKQTKLYLSNDSCSNLEHRKGTLYLCLCCTFDISASLCLKFYMSQNLVSSDTGLNCSHGSLLLLQGQRAHGLFHWAGRPAWPFKGPAPDFWTLGVAERWRWKVVAVKIQGQPGHGAVNSASQAGGNPSDQLLLTSSDRTHAYISSMCAL